MTIGNGWSDALSTQGIVELTTTKKVGIRRGGNGGGTDCQNLILSTRQSTSNVFYFEVDVNRLSIYDMFAVGVAAPLAPLDRRLGRDSNQYGWGVQFGTGTEGSTSKGWPFPLWWSEGTSHVNSYGDQENYDDDGLTINIGVAVNVTLGEIWYRFNGAWFFCNVGFFSDGGAACAYAEIPATRINTYDPVRIALSISKDGTTFRLRESAAEFLYPAPSSFAPFDTSGDTYAILSTRTPRVSAGITSSIEHEEIIGMISATLPAVTASIEAQARIDGITVSLPAITAKMGTSCGISATLRKVTAAMTARTSMVASVSAELPAVLFSASSGAFISCSLHRAHGSVAASQQITSNILGRLATVTAKIAARSGGMASVSGSVPSVWADIRTAGKGSTGTIKASLKTVVISLGARQNLNASIAISTPSVTGKMKANLSGSGSISATLPLVAAQNRAGYGDLEIELRHIREEIR